MSFEKLLLKNRQKLYESVKMPGANEVRKSIEESNKRDIARSTLLSQPKPDKIFIRALPKGILLNGDPEYKFLNIDGYSFGEKSLQEQFAILEKSGFPRPLNYESMTGQQIQSYLLTKIQQVNQVFPVIKDINMWLVLEPVERNNILQTIGDPRKLDDYKLENLATAININVNRRFGEQRTATADEFTQLKLQNKLDRTSITNSIEGSNALMTENLLIYGKKNNDNLIDAINRGLGGVNKNIQDNVGNRLQTLTENFSDFNNKYDRPQEVPRNPLEDPIPGEGAGGAPPGSPMPHPRQEYVYELIDPNRGLSQRRLKEWNDSQPGSIVTGTTRDNAKRSLYKKGYTRKRNIDTGIWYIYDKNLEKDVREDSI